MTGALCKICASVLFAMPPAAAFSQCRLALLLSMDVSSSMTPEDYDLQRTGLAAAFTSPDVAHTILSGGGFVALAAYEWSGRNQQKTVLPWRILQSQQDIDAAALTLLTTKRSYDKYPTAIGYSLWYGAQLLAQSPPCDRKVVDVSGDGINNDGFGPRQAYRHTAFDDVTINGLVIKGRDPDVEWFYETEVLLGPQAFLEIAEGFSDFERAMTSKLFREISNVQIGLAPRPGSDFGVAMAGPKS